MLLLSLASGHHLLYCLKICFYWPSSTQDQPEKKSLQTFFLFLTELCFTNSLTFLNISNTNLPFANSVQESVTLNDYLRFLWWDILFCNILVSYFVFSPLCSHVFSNNFFYLIWQFHLHWFKTVRGSDFRITLTGQCKVEKAKLQSHLHLTIYSIFFLLILTPIHASCHL